MARQPGLILVTNEEWNNGSFLSLPFVPTETQISRNLQYAEIAPPGNSGTFFQFTQGGSHQYKMELFLNDIGRNFEDPIKGALRTHDSGGQLLSLSTVDDTLTFLHGVSNSFYDNDNVWRGPSVLMLTIAQHYKGLYLITALSVQVIQRYKRTLGESKRGRVSRARVNITLSQYHQIPTPGTNAFAW